MSRHDLAGLDALRAIAILLVIFAHLFSIDMPFATEQLGLAAANVGVILFFFLSGFLMDRTFSLDPRPLPYAIRRSFRILPMYWVSLILVFTFDPHWSTPEIIANAFFAAPAVHLPRMAGIYWTLYIEVLFYALVPVLWLLGERVIYATIFVVIAVFSILVAFHLLPAWSPFSWAPFYIVYCFGGMQIGRWHRGELGAGLLAISLVAVIIGSAALPVVSPWLGFAPLLCAAGLILALRRERPVFGLTIISNVSYSWYLLHTIIGLPMMEVLHLPAVLLHSIIAAVTFIASILTYRLVELPLMYTGKILSRTLRIPTRTFKAS